MLCMVKCDLSKNTEITMMSLSILDGKKVREKRYKWFRIVLKRIKGEMHFHVNNEGSIIIIWEG